MKANMQTILGDIRLEEPFQDEVVGLDKGRDGFDGFGIVVDLSLLSSESELEPESVLMRRMKHTLIDCSLRTFSTDLFPSRSLTCFLP